MSHFSNDVRNLAPLPFLKTDRYESCHAFLKQIRLAKRNSRNVNKTMITNKELLNVYNATGETIPADIEKTIVKECCDEIVLNYLKTYKVPGNTIYECSKLVSFGTEYQKDTYVILPSSTNKNILLGKIEKILACQKYGYVLYQKALCEYNHNTDLLMVNELQQCDVIPLYQLSDPRPLHGYEIGRESYEPIRVVT